MEHVFALVVIANLLVVVMLAVQTRALFTQWRTVAFAGFLFGLGLTPYLFISLFSMANPPMNWGYPRTVEGFLHAITRGQYERMWPVDSFGSMNEALFSYTFSFKRDFGIPYALMGIIPLLTFHRFKKSSRQIILGLLGLFLSLSLFMIYLLNPAKDRASVDLHAQFFAPSHLILSILAGCGLMIAGLFVSAPEKRDKL